MESNLIPFPVFFCCKIAHFTQFKQLSNDETDSPSIYYIIYSCAGCVHSDPTLNMSAYGCSDSPAMSVELQVEELVLAGHSSFCSLVFTVQDIGVIGQSLIVPDVFIQSILILTCKERIMSKERQLVRILHIL